MKLLHPRNSRKAFSLAKLTAFFLLFTLSGCSGGPVKEVSAVPELLEPVDFKPDTAEVVREDLRSIRYLDGQVIPGVAELVFPADGIIDSSSLSVGRKVSKGEVLLTLDEKENQEHLKKLEEEISYQEKNAAFLEEQSRLDLEIARTKQRMLSEEKELWGASLELSKLEVEETELSGRQAREQNRLQLNQLKKQAETLRSGIGHSSLTAPCSGHILSVPAGLLKGSRVQAYATAGFLSDDSQRFVSCEYVSDSVLAAADRIYAKIGAKEYDLIPEPVDQAAYLSAALAGEKFQSKFTVNALPEAVSALKPGQYACIYLVSNSRKNVLTIPANALYRNSSGAYVYKIEDDRQVRCEVEIGLITDARVEICSGLQEGDTVYVKE